VQATSHGEPEVATSKSCHLPQADGSAPPRLRASVADTVVQPVLPPDLAAIPEAIHRPESVTLSDVLRRENEVLRRQLEASARRPSTATTVPWPVQAPLAFPRYRRQEPTSDNISQRTSTTPTETRRHRLHAPQLIDYHSSAASSRAAPLSVAQSMRSRRTAASNRSVLVGTEVFSVVHQVTDALLQVTNQTKNDAVARERLLLQQQQLLQRDFIDKEIRNGELSLKKEKKQMDKEVKEKQWLADKEIKEKQMQLERERIAAVAAEKEKQLLVEERIKEKQLMNEREAEEKRIQFEREKIVALTVEKERQLQFERENMVAEAMDKERQMQLERDKLVVAEKQKLMEMAEKERLMMEERIEKEKEKMRLEYEEKAELKSQLAEEKQRSVTLEGEVSRATHEFFTEQHRFMGVLNRAPRAPALVKGLSEADNQVEMDRRISALMESLPVISSSGGTSHQSVTKLQAAPLITSQTDFESLHSNSLTQTPTHTSQTALASHVHRPTYTTLPCVHAEKTTDLHLQQAQFQTTDEMDSQVSIKSPCTPNTMAQTSVPHLSLDGQTTTMKVQGQSDNQTGHTSKECLQPAPEVSTEVTSHTPNRGTYSGKSEAFKNDEGPNAPQPPVAANVKNSTVPTGQIVSNQPSVVVVRQSHL